MSENATPEQRTEMPTGRRMGELRKHGQLHSSKDVSIVVSLVAGLLGIQLVWQHLINNLMLVMRESFEIAGADQTLNISFVYGRVYRVLSMVGPSVFTITVIVAVAASLAVMIQTGWNIKQKKIDIKWNFLNPINGIKKVFSLQGLVNTLKAIFKLCLILPVGFFALKALAPNMINLMFLNVPAVMRFTGGAAITTAWRIIYVLILFAIFDYVYGKWQWLRQNKMTKEEVKDERKSVEGDEATKKKILAKGLSRIVQRIRETVPQADVVLTNPTHFSVALKYDGASMGAPMVVAKGRGEIALRIREIAKDAGVPILERKPLARALYATAKVGGEIPYDLFKAVAEVFAFLYRTKRLKRQR